jgi:hypothetical protein
MKFLPLLVMLLTLCAALTAAQPSPEEQLGAAEAKWAMKKPQAYEFTYTQLCLCPSPQTPGWEPIVFRVTNGVGSAISPGRMYDASKFSTVEKQFEFIRQELAKHHDRVSITYDPDYGHPTHVYFGQGITTDRDYGFNVEGFTRLTR